MTIIKDIVEEVIKLIENDSIKYSYNTFEDSCVINFGNKQITILNFYNMEEKYYYYQINISKDDTNFDKYKIVVPSKNADLLERTKYLYELVKTKHFDSDTYLQKVLSELKTGVFEEKETKLDNSNDNSNDEPVDDFDKYLP